MKSINNSLKNVLFFIIIIIIILYLLPIDNILGRQIWYKPKKIMDYEFDGKGTSKQLFDIYTISHIIHGILFYFILL